VIWGSPERCCSHPRWLIIACALLAAACRRDASQNLVRADRLLATGQTKQAIVEYQGALAVEPSAHAERGLGLAYEALSAYGMAERHLAAALEAKPDDVDARVALARVSTHFGRYAKARTELLTVLEQHPDCEPALLLFGVYAETRQQMQQAIDAIEGFEERQRKAGRQLTHTAELVLAELLARTNRSDAALTIRENLRLAPSGDARLTLVLGQAAADRGNHALARALLVPLVERHPDETDAWQVLALSALELGKLTEARDAMAHLRERSKEFDVRLLHARLGLASGLETGPTAELRGLLSEIPSDQAKARARVRRYLADALIAQRKLDEARAELDGLLAEHPGDVDGSLALAELALARGEYADTLQVLSALTDHHGQLARAYAILGRAQLGLAQLDAAEASFRRLWELAPHEPDARYWLAVALWRRGQVDQARRLLEGNLKRFPTHVDSVNAMALLREQSAGVADAKAFLLEHGRAHADSPEIASAEGDWLARHQDSERALAAYRRALRQNPSHYPAVLALAHFYTRRGKSMLARSVIDDALTHDPKDLRVLLLAARNASEARRYDEARQFSERAVALSPDQPDALAELASIEAEGFRDIARARDLAARAYSEAPANTAVLDAVGWVKHLGGDSENAARDLQRAVEQDPDNPRVLYHLGAALLGAGQASAAHERFERVLSLDPTFPTAHEIRLVLARR
jgi:tetratricopeptide (TPR) repeat protein